MKGEQVLRDRLAEVLADAYDRRGVPVEIQTWVQVLADTVIRAFQLEMCCDDAGHGVINGFLPLDGDG